LFNVLFSVVSLLILFLLSRNKTMQRRNLLNICFLSRHCNRLLCHKVFRQFTYLSTAVLSFLWSSLC
jgi:hypothetical protein